MMRPQEAKPRQTPTHPSDVSIRSLEDGSPGGQDSGPGAMTETLKEGQQHSPNGLALPAMLSPTSLQERTQPLT